MVKPVQPRRVEYYVSAGGISPVKDWLHGMTDTTAKVAIYRRLANLERGLLGDWGSVGDGICEMRIDVGKGYRVYFRELGPTIILLITGGDKRSQKKDIKFAKKYWKDYEARDENTEN